MRIIKLKSLLLFAAALILVSGLALASEERTVSGEKDSVLTYEYKNPRRNDPFDEVSVFQGSFPAGVALHQWDSSSLMITGIPTAAGNSEVVLRLEWESGRSDTLTIRFSVTERPTNAFSESVVYTPENVVTEAPATLWTPAPESGSGLCAVKIIKSPTGETVNEGESTSFISRAENAEKIIWHIVSPDAGLNLIVKEALQYFSGLEITGAGTEKLYLGNIPYEMNGWSVCAEFTDAGGSVFSEAAVLKVNEAVLPVPQISSQPMGATLSDGGQVRLEVAATALSGNLNYQWYKNTVGSDSGGILIAGATESTYVPPAAAGSAWYYVEIWASSGTKKSESVRSVPAEVLYEIPAAMPVPEAREVSVWTPATEAPVSDERRAENEQQNAPVDALTLRIVAVSACVAVVFVCITVLTLSSRRERRRREK